MSDTSTNPAEPTENQPGGKALQPNSDTTTATTEEGEGEAAEPTENQGGGSD